MAGERATMAAASLLGVLSVAVPLLVVTSAADPYTRPKIIALWLGLAAVAGCLLAGRVALVVMPRIDGALAIFLALAAIATAFSVDRVVSLVGERLHYQGLATACLYAGFFVVARTVGFARGSIEPLIDVIVVGVGLVAAYAVGQELGFDPYWGNRIAADRVFGSIGQPNALGAFLVTGLAPAIWLVGGDDVRSRLLGAGATSAIAVAVLWSESRGAYLASLVVVPVGVAAAVVRWRSRHDGGPPGRGGWIRAAVGVGVVAVGWVAVAGWFDEPAERFATIFDGTAEVSARDHWDQWTVAVHLVREHPLLGTGPDTFPLVFPEASRAVLDDDAVRNFDQFRVESPHNVTLAIAAGSGIPAVLAWLATLGAMGAAHVAAIRAGREVAVALMAIGVLSGFLLTSMFITADTSTSWLFWLLMGLGLAGVHKQQRSGT